jgi:hypothetical protein
MSVSRFEFDRQLQPLLDGWTADRFSDRWVLRRSEQCVVISCKVLSPRRIGWLELQQTAIEIIFEAFSKEEEALFLQRFWRYFQRGGG